MVKMSSYASSISSTGSILREKIQEKCDVGIEGLKNKICSMAQVIEDKNKEIQELLDGILEMNNAMRDLKVCCRDKINSLNMYVVFLHFPVNLRYVS